MRNKVIIGQPVYMYRGSRWLEMPKGAYVHKQVYNEEDDTLTYYCRRKTIWFEALCVLGIMMCFIFMYYTQGNEEILSIKCNSSPIYYNDYLYLNMLSEVEDYNVSFMIYDDKGSLVNYGSLPYGDVVTRVKANGYCNKYTVTFLLRKLNSDETLSQSCTVFAVKKEKQ